MKCFLQHFFARRVTCVLVLFVLLGAPSLVRAQVSTFNGCGTLVPGVTCPLLFQADGGGLFVLKSYGGFNIGDYVRVVGTLDPFCVTVCMEGNGCIIDNTISSCGSPVKQTTWGKIKALYRLGTV